MGTVLVTLLLGMAWLRSSSLLLNLAKEWLPARPRPLLMLPRLQGTLILSPCGKPSRVPHIGLTYLGLEEQAPKFRLDVLKQIAEQIVSEVEIKKLLANHENAPTKPSVLVVG